MTIDNLNIANGTNARTSSGHASNAFINTLSQYDQPVGVTTFGTVNINGFQFADTDGGSYGAVAEAIYLGTGSEQSTIVSLNGLSTINTHNITSVIDNPANAGIVYPLSIGVTVGTISNVGGSMTIQPNTSPSNGNLALLSAGSSSLFLGSNTIIDFCNLAFNCPAAVTPAGAFTGTSYKTTPLTVATLPSASTAGNGAMIVVSDSTSFTLGTCTGGGSYTMIAVSNGSSWSCH